MQGLFTEFLVNEENTEAGGMDQQVAAITMGLWRTMSQRRMRQTVQLILAISCHEPLVRTGNTEVGVLILAREARTMKKE
jgi:hypothetical protein